MKYSQELIDLCLSKTTQQISKTPLYRELLINQTKFLDNVSGVVLGTRKYCVNNNIHEIPKCKSCDSFCTVNRLNSKLGFTTYCSPKCSRASKTVIKTVEVLLSNRDWLYNERIVLKKSKEVIAEDLGISITPVNKWLGIHNIPNIKYNCSHPSAVMKLSDKDWLYDEHKNKHRTCSDIGVGLGVSKSMVSVWLATHNIMANEANSYDRLSNKSSAECAEVSDYIKSIYDGEIQLDKRGVIGSLELDIYLPEIKLAIEYNGLYSHIYRPEESSFSGRKDSNYHYTKTKLCNEQGIQLLHIFSDSWKERSSVWKSFISNKLHNNQYKIFARKCIIKEICVSDKNNFLDDNHIQGKDKSRFKYGMFFGEDLVAVMTFGVSRYSKKYKWELIRFAIKKNYCVVGAFSKLLKHFRKNNEGSIISYADRTYSNGDVYINNGFTLISTNKPGYHYVAKNVEKRLHRSNFVKSKISGCGDTRTEQEIMFDMDYSKIYDCGTLSFAIW